MEGRRPLNDLATLTIDVRAGVAIARIAGEIDISNAEEIERGLRSAGRDDGHGLVVDLTGVQFLDSAWLHLATRVSADVRGRGRDLCLVVPPDATVRRTLLLAGMTSVVPMVETEEEAIARVSAPPGGDGRRP